MYENPQEFSLGYRTQIIEGFSSKHYSQRCDGTIEDLKVFDHRSDLERKRLLKLFRLAIDREM